MNEDLSIDLVARLWASMGSVTASAIRILIILTLAWIVLRLVKRTINLFQERMTTRLDGDAESLKRAATLGRVFRYILQVVVWLITGMVVLGELGVSVAPILGAAGVVGLAVGFGAQSLVRDYFTGFFLLLENQIRQGDVVKLSGEHAGFVEQVTLRFVQLRDYDGRVHFVPNGQISSVINMTREFSFAVMDIGVAYRENTDEVIGVMKAVAAELRADEEFGPRILDDLDVAGVDAWADSAVMIKCRFKTVALSQWMVKRAYLGRLKKAFDAHGIEIPYPHMTVYAGQDKDGSAPPVPLQVLRSKAVPSAETSTASAAAPSTGDAPAPQAG